MILLLLVKHLVTSSFLARDCDLPACDVRLTDLGDRCQGANGGKSESVGVLVREAYPRGEESEVWKVDHRMYGL